LDTGELAFCHDLARPVIPPSSTTWRIRARRRACERLRKLLLDPEAWHQRRVSACQSHAPETVVGEFDFRYNNQVALGVNDAQRAEKVAKGAAGKRLTYQRTRQQPEAEAS
jgi:hypothetical protein